MGLLNLASWFNWLGFLVALLLLTAVFTQQWWQRWKSRPGPPRFQTMRAIERGLMATLALACVAALGFLLLHPPTIRGADLTGLRVGPHADLAGRALSRANLAGRNLSGANLEGADLYGANLRGALLTKARLDRARLHDADLTGANLGDADLSEAQELELAILDGACYNRHTRWPTGFDPRARGAFLVERTQ